MIVLHSFEFNTRIIWLLFYCIATKVDDCNSIIAVINSTNTIVVQPDHSNVILIVLMNELLRTNTVQTACNHGQMTVKPPSNDRPTRVKQGSNTGKTMYKIHNTTKQYFKKFCLDQYGYCL